MKERELVINKNKWGKSEKGSTIATDMMDALVDFLTKTEEVGGDLDLKETREVTVLVYKQ